MVHGGTFSCGSLVQFFNLRCDFPILGKPVEGLLGKQELAVDFYLENSSAGGDEFRINLEFIAEFACQTGGAWFVISNLTVFDGDFHENPFLVVNWSGEPA